MAKTETNPPDRRRLPRHALGPLAVCGEAAVFAVLAMVAANRVEGGPDNVLLAFGWVAVAVSAGAALVFAGRSGRLDGQDRDADRRPASNANGSEAAPVVGGGPAKPGAASTVSWPTPLREGDR